MTDPDRPLTPAEAAELEAQLGLSDTEAAVARFRHDQPDEHDHDWDRAAHEAQIEQARKTLGNATAPALRKSVRQAADVLQLLHAQTHLQMHEACDAQDHEMEQLLADRMDWYELAVVLLREQESTLAFFGSGTDH